MSIPFFLLFWVQLRSDLERDAIKPPLGDAKCLPSSHWGHPLGHGLVPPHIRLSMAITPLLHFCHEMVGQDPEGMKPEVALLSESS